MPDLLKEIFEELVILNENGGGGGGGTGDASATNQATQITAADLTNTKLDALNSKDFATEVTQLLIKDKTNNLDIALSALRDALRGTNSKTNSDIVTTQDTGNAALSAILALEKVLASRGTVFKEQRTYPRPTVGGNFANNVISAKSWITSQGTSGTGTVTAANNQAVVNTGASGGTAVLQSTKPLRYTNGCMSIERFTAEWAGLSLTNGQYLLVGLGHQVASPYGAVQNGVFIGYLNDTTLTGGVTLFGQVIFQQGVILSFKALTDFPVLNANGIGNTGRTWDATEAAKGGIFELDFAYLGKAVITSSIMPPATEANIGTVSPQYFAFYDHSDKAGNHLGEPSLYLMAIAKGGNNNIIRIGSMAGFVATSGEDVQPKPQHTSETFRTTIGAEVPILAVRGRTLNGFSTTNALMLHLLSYMQASGALAGILRFYKGGTIAGVAPVWAAFGTDSAYEFTTTATNTYTGGTKFLPNMYSFINQPTTVNFLTQDTAENVRASIQPWEQLVITFASSGTNINLYFDASFYEI